MIVYRVIAGFFGLLVIATIGMYYMEFVAYAGFPDGHLTEFASAMRVVYWLTTIPAAVITYHLFSLALGAEKPRPFYKLMMVLLAIIVCVVIFILVQDYLYANTNHGQMA